MTPEMTTKRNELKGISRVIQQAVKAGVYESVNEGLMNMYREQGHTTLHSFKQWLEQGYCVRKGERALLLWGEPRKAANKEKKSEKEEDEFSFFPLAYVFSQLQVDKLNK